MGLGTLHEINKAHPRDWENPGRVRVQWKKDGRLVDPSIKTSASPTVLTLACLSRLVTARRETAPRADSLSDPTGQA